MADRQPSRACMRGSLNGGASPTRLPIDTIVVRTITRAPAPPAYRGPMDSVRSTLDAGIEATFARIAAGSRIVASMWMAILGAVTIARDADVDRAVVVGMIVVGLVWALGATVVAYPADALSRGMLAVDLAVGVLSLLAPGFAGGSEASFYGGLPLIVVSIAALRGRLEGLVSAVVLVIVAVGTIVTNISFREIVGETTLILAYLGVGILVAWIGDVLRQAEAQLVEANDAVAEARAEAAREAERADIGRHLHDSVLQTLALIQRDSDDPQRVTIQARRQERELRDWLFGVDATDAPGFEEGIRRAAADVEERYGVTVDAVVVGDRPPSTNVTALVAAATEAMTNAARHGGVSEVDVYGEAAADSLVVYVRDRGVGFDPDAIPPDRQGVRSSIVGRLAALGGESIVKSSPERGTEWRMTVPTERIETDVR